jgi:hypothetical protein
VVLPPRSNKDAIPDEALGFRVHAVYILERVWLEVFGKEDENVCMRQPTLLEINGINSRNRASHNKLLVNVINHFLQFDFEHSGYQIRSIPRLLSGQQHSLDLRPLGIVSECNKRIQAMGPSTDCHGILIILNHVTWTSCERRWQNDPLSNGNNAIVTCNDGVLKALIEIYTKLFLIQAQIPQAILFDNRISIHNVLLLQSVTLKQRNAINVSMLKSITVKSGHCHIVMLSMMLKFSSQTCPLHVFMHLQHFNDAFKVQC